MSIGNEIKRRREDAGIKQEELARVICISQPMLSQYERGYKLPSLAVLARIADALGTTPAAILEAGTASGTANAAAKEVRA